MLEVSGGAAVAHLALRRAGGQLTACRRRPRAVRLDVHDPAYMSLYRWVACVASLLLTRRLWIRSLGRIFDHWVEAGRDLTSLLTLAEKFKLIVSVILNSELNR